MLGIFKDERRGIASIPPSLSGTGRQPSRSQTLKDEQ